MITLILYFVIPFDYIYPGAGTKGLSCGSYFTKEDITSLWWNPANSYSESPSLYLDWTNLIQSFNLYNFAAGFNAKGVNLSFGINYFSSGEMPLNSDIEDTIIPENTGYFSVNERMITISISKKIKLLNLGINIKNYEQEIVSFHGTGFGYDLGFTFGKLTKISLTLKDFMDTKLKWFGNTIDKLPQSTIIASSVLLKYKDYNFFTEVSYVFNNLGNFYAFGSEITIRDLISMRIGYSKIKGISLGIGLDFSQISLYYTIMNSNYEPTHIFGLILKKKKGGIYER